MGKEEFLHHLEEALQGEVPSSVIDENLRYYSSYIADERKKGFTEEEVTAGIGDPRLIAKTIIESTEYAREGYADSGPFVRQSEERTERSVHYIDLNKWYWKLLAVAAVILFFTLVFALITGLLSLVLPILIPFCLILFLYYWIRSMFRR